MSNADVDLPDADKKTTKTTGKGKVSKLTKGSVPSAGGKSPLARMMSRLIGGIAGGAAKMGLFAVGASTVLLPLAAIGLTEAYFGDQFRAATDKRVSDIKARKVLGGERLTGFEDFSGVDLGKSMLQPEGRSKSLAAYAKLPERKEEELYQLQELMIKKGTNQLEEYFQMESARKNETVPPGIGPSVVNNSGNTNTTNVGNQIVTQDGVSDKKIFEAFKSDTSGIL